MDYLSVRFGSQKVPHINQSITEPNHLGHPKQALSSAHEKYDVWTRPYSSISSTYS